MPKPVRMVRAPIRVAEISAVPALRAMAREASSAPALSTSAQAVPSGNLSWPCCWTIRARRIGIIMRIPSSPPRTPTIKTCRISRSKPRIRMAGIVAPKPKAIDSPADPAVWTMLCSRIVAGRTPTRANNRKSVKEMTAIGIEALTVRPVFSTR